VCHPAAGRRRAESRFVVELAAAAQSPRLIRATITLQSEVGPCCGSPPPATPTAPRCYGATARSSPPWLQGTAHAPDPTQLPTSTLRRPEPLRCSSRSWRRTRTTARPAGRQPGSAPGDGAGSPGSRPWPTGSRSCVAAHPVPSTACIAWPGGSPAPGRGCTPVLRRSQAGRLGPAVARYAAGRLRVGGPAGCPGACGHPGLTASVTSRAALVRGAARERADGPARLVNAEEGEPPLARDRSRHGPGERGCAVGRTGVRERFWWVLRPHLNSGRQSSPERFRQAFCGSAEIGIPVNRNTSTHYSGESAVPFLIHSLVSIEPSLIVSLLSDTSSGELFPVIIGLSVWYRWRRRRPYADRWGRQSPCSTGLARLPPRIAWPRTGGARPERARL
jgi:hypothetical protein